MELRQLEKVVNFALLKEREGLWQEDWNSLLEYVLYESRTPLSLPALVHHLKTTFSFAITPGKRVIKTHLAQLVESKRITEGKKSQYQLTDWKRDEYTERITENKKVFRNFEATVLQKIRERGKQIEPYIRRSVADAVRSFLALFLASQSIATLAQLSRSSAEKHIHYFDPYIRASARIFGKTTPRQMYIDAMLDAIVEAPFSDFFWRGLQNLICLEIMRVNPAIQDFRRLFLNDPIVYLDSNFVISVLLSSRQRMHEVADLVCDEMQRLAIGARVTTSSLGEVLGQFEDAQQVMDIAGDLPASSTNPFLNDFKKSREAASLTWFQYSLKYRTRDALSDTLQREYGIVTEDVDWTEILSLKDHEYYMDLVANSWEDLRKTTKSPEAVEHDALHLLLVNGLRQGPRKGKSAWFVTFDLSLCLLSRSLQERAGDRPLTILADSWLQTLSLFPSFEGGRLPSVSRIMMDFLASRWSTALPALEVQKVQEILGDLENAPKDFNELLQVAEDIVIQQRVTSPTVQALREEMMDYNGVLHGLRGRRISQLEEARKASVKKEAGLSLSLEHRLGLTLALILAGSTVGYIIFRCGGNKLLSPFVLAYVASFLGVATLLDAVWENKVTKFLVKAARTIKQWHWLTALRNLLL